VKVVTKGRFLNMDCNAEEMLMLLKASKLPSGQMKMRKFRDIYPDAKCEVLARLMPEDSTGPEEEPPEFKMLEFTKEYDHIIE
jgi:hypothetical protein